MINRILSKFGYEMRNLTYANTFPYSKKISLFDTEFDFWIPDDVARRWYDVDLEKNFVELELIKKLIEPTDNVLEIGTHYGFYSTFISRNLAPESKFFGVEIQPKCVMYAQAQFRLNDIESNKVFINAAGSDSDDKIRFLPKENGNAFVAVSEQGLEIPSITGDYILKRAGKINLLKVDVEGFEVKVLKGCREILKFYPKIFLEVHNSLMGNFGNKTEELFELIDFDKYEGYMYIRPQLKAIPFDKSLLSSGDLVNIFLIPKQI